MTRDAFQERHNRFIDSIFSRINRIVSETFDPLVVRLSGHSEPEASKRKISTENANASQKTHNHKGEHTTKKELDNEKKAQQKTKVKQQEDSEPPIANLAEEMRTVVENVVLDAVDANLLQKKPLTNSSESKIEKSSKKSTGKKNKVRQSGSNSNSQKENGKQLEKLEKTEASLSGLDSLKRVGNVKVVSDAEGRNSTIKAKFTLGPLILRVEKSFKRGSVRSVKSATARTNQMIGRIKFSVENERATLMSIKVQQPKQVEVESKDDKDHRRDFVWRRSPKIAKLINERLKIAAETIFSTHGLENVNL